LDISKTTILWEGKSCDSATSAIGISDWTNTSRTFDVIRTVIGNLTSP